jgi:multiple sugar transport system permease protein
MRKMGMIGRQANLYGLFFIAPAFLLLIVFFFYPIVSGLILSFMNWDGVHQKQYIGFMNFVKMFHDPMFYTSFLNTLYFVVGTVPTTIVLSVIFAVLLNRGLKGTTFFRGVYFMPTIVSTIAISIVWKWIYNGDSGLLNSFLYKLGLSTPDWLNNTHYSMFAIIIMSVWKPIGSSIVIVLAGLQGIPGTLYEAAHIDGANELRRFWHITLPLLSPVTFFVTVITLIASFQVFEQVLVMTGGGPGNSTLVMVFYIYREAFQNFNLGYSSTLAFVLFIIIFLVTLLQWFAQRYWVNSELE